MLKKTIALIGLALSIGANAAIIDLGAITRDTVTGLDWLDVTETRGLSYNEVSAQFGVGEAYEGYRYATTAELDQLITNFGYVAVDKNCPYGLTNCDDGIAGDSSIVEAMIRTLGDTFDAWGDELSFPQDVSPDGAGYTYGIVADTPFSTDPGIVGLGMIYDLERVDRDEGTPYDDIDDKILPTYSDNDKTFKGDHFGSYLVAPSAVPLPAAGWLFISALVGLGVVKRRKV